MQVTQQQRADPVDSTMHDPADASMHDNVLTPHNSGPTVLHGISSSSMATLLRLLGSLFPAKEGENGWQKLADAAAKEPGCVHVLSRVPRCCFAQLCTVVLLALLFLASSVAMIAPQAARKRWFAISN